MFLRKSPNGRALRTALTFAALAVVGVASQATAQIRPSVKPLKIKRIIGKDTVRVGDIETYRVTVNDPKDVEYRWSAGDRSAYGNPVVHRFERPGTIVVSVTARNVISTVADTLVITVLGDEPPSPPVAVAETTAGGKSGGPKPEATEASAKQPESLKAAPQGTSAGLRGTEKLSANATGYTWVIATYFTRPSAVALANSYRASGFRSGVISDTEGQGSEVFRVILGQFRTKESAARARPHLIAAGHKNVLLRELRTTG